MLEPVPNVDDDNENENDTVNEGELGHESQSGNGNGGNNNCDKIDSDSDAVTNAENFDLQGETVETDLNPNPGQNKVENQDYGDDQEPEGQFTTEIIDDIINHSFQLISLNEAINNYKAGAKGKKTKAGRGILKKKKETKKKDKDLDILTYPSSAYPLIYIDRDKSYYQSKINENLEHSSTFINKYKPKPQPRPIRYDSNLLKKCSKCGFEGFPAVQERSVRKRSKYFLQYLQFCSRQSQNQSTRPGRLVVQNPNPTFIEFFYVCELCGKTYGRLNKNVYSQFYP